MVDVRELRERLERLTREIEQLAHLPEDDFVEGDAIQFKRRFSWGGEWYSYVALKGARGWYICGATRSGSHVSWPSLSELLRSDDVKEAWFATGWEELEL